MRERDAGEGEVRFVINPDQACRRIDKELADCLYAREIFTPLIGALVAIEC